MTEGAVNWQESHRGDPVAVRLADRHYNRQKPGSSQFVPPGLYAFQMLPEAMPEPLVPLGAQERLVV